MASVMIDRDFMRRMREERRAGLVLPLIQMMLRPVGPSEASSSCLMIPTPLKRQVPHPSASAEATYIPWWRSSNNAVASVPAGRFFERANGLGLRACIEIPYVPLYSESSFI